MLQGLGQHLRCCGVDVTIMDNNSDHAKLLEVRLIYRSFTRWRHFTTSTRILQGIAFLCKLRLLLSKPHWGYQILKEKYDKKKEKDSFLRRKITPSCKWPILSCILSESVEQKNIDCLIWFEPLTFQTASESIIYWATKYETCVKLSHLLGSCLIRVLYSVRIRSVESLLYGVTTSCLCNGTHH